LTNYAIWSLAASSQDKQIMATTTSKGNAGEQKQEPLLSIRQLVKRFGGLTAVNKVDMEIDQGEVVGLVGDNGAGKSTLIKCVSGVHQPEEGEIHFQGARVRFPSPIDARRAGIETIYQDLALAGNLNVSANIFLGREVKRSYLGGVVRTLDEDHMLDESERILDTLEIKIPNFKAQIEKLSGGQRQAVAIARAMYWNAKLMIMDEPCNNLGVPEQRKVLDLIRKLRDQGVPVILITHTLPDVFAVTDRIVIMHRGRKVAEKRTVDTDSQEIVEYMVGARDDSRADEAENPAESAR
jgi:ABC-type sugar transport system ATPase subunit